MAVATKSAIILDRIKELPPLPLVVRKLLAVMEDERSSAEDVSAVLASDQALAAKVLKLVNSSFYGMSGQVSTVSRAVVILGMSAVRNLALGLSIAGIMGKGRQSSLWSRFWDHSLAAATAADYLARRTGYPDPEEAFVAGLLHDVGHLVFMMAAPDEFCALQRTPRDDMLAEEEQALGLTHTRCGQKLLKHWKLPRPLEQAVRFHHTGSVMTSGEDDLVTLTATADLLAGPLCGTYEGAPSRAEFAELLKLTRLDAANLGETLAALAARLEDTRAFLQIALEEDELPPTGTASTVESGLEVAVVSTDPHKTAWTQQILTYQGHEILPMKAFFAQASQGRWPDLVILDAASVSPEHFAKTAPLLRQTHPFLALLGPENREQAEAALGAGLRHLPLGFSPEDLRDFLDGDS